MTYEDWKRTRLVMLPDRCGGQPTLGHTRLQPRDVASRIRGCDTLQSVLADYPYLAPEDIVYSLRYVEEVQRMSPHDRVLQHEVELFRAEVDASPRCSGEMHKRLDSLGMMLTSVKAQLDGETTVYVYGPKGCLLAGLGWVTSVEPKKVYATSIRVGNHPDRVSDDESLDISNAEPMAGVSRGASPVLRARELPYRKFDLGCFSGYFPLIMTFEVPEGRAELDLILVSHVIQASR